MNLRDVLKLPEFSGKTAQECLDVGNNVQVIGTDNSLYHYNGLGKILQDANADISILLDIPGWIKSLNGGQSLDVFLMTGIDFSLSGIQYYLQSNLISKANDVNSTDADRVAINAMLNTGIIKGTLWQKYNTPSPTLETIQAALAQIATENDRNAFIQKFNTVNAKFDSGEITNLTDALVAMNNV
jgi:hypothetical protein